MVELAYDQTGYLVEGLGAFPLAWQHFKRVFGRGGKRYRWVSCLESILISLGNAGCHEVLIDGSFASRNDPKDIDICINVTKIQIAKLPEALRAALLSESGDWHSFCFLNSEGRSDGDDFDDSHDQLHIDVFIRTAKLDLCQLLSVAKHDPTKKKGMIVIDPRTISPSPPFN